jgi:hypothetical protein
LFIDINGYWSTFDVPVLFNRATDGVRRDADPHRPDWLFGAAILALLIATIIPSGGL